MKKPEILSPAGNLEKLKFAFEYGADAVYCSGRNYGLRAYAGNLSEGEIKEGVKIAAEKGKKLYVTVNVFPRNNELKNIEKHLAFLNDIKADGVIVSDPGVFKIAKDAAPNVPIHVSVQANNMNYSAAEAWRDMGAKRVVLARELSSGEIGEITGKAPGLETEIFVHGAVCVSYSGRCLLSNYLAGRDANRGQCAQPCRWKYYLTEEKRPGEYMPVFEDDRGAYILNAKDLNLLSELDRFMEAGVDSFKIEGRMKSVYYTAITAAVYKKAVELYAEGKKPGKELFEELNNVSHREYTTGFYFDDGQNTENYESSDYITGKRFAGFAVSSGKGGAEFEIKHSFKINDKVGVFTPSAESFEAEVVSIKDNEGIETIKAAQNKRYTIDFKSEKYIQKYSLLRI